MNSETISLKSVHIFIQSRKDLTQSISLYTLSLPEEKDVKLFSVYSDFYGNSCRSFNPFHAITQLDRPNIRGFPVKEGSQ
jgi:hypothetical protein